MYVENLDVELQKIAWTGMKSSCGKSLIKLNLRAKNSATNLFQIGLVRSLVDQSGRPAVRSKMCMVEEYKIEIGYCPLIKEVCTGKEKKCVGYYELPAKDHYELRCSCLGPNHLLIGRRYEIPKKEKVF